MFTRKHFVRWFSFEQLKCILSFFLLNDLVVCLQSELVTFSHCADHVDGEDVGDDGEHSA